MTHHALLRKPTSVRARKCWCCRAVSLVFPPFACVPHAQMHSCCTRRDFNTHAACSSDAHDDHRWAMCSTCLGAPSTKLLPAATAPRMSPCLRTSTGPWATSRVPFFRWAAAVVHEDLRLVPDPEPQDPSGVRGGLCGRVCASLKKRAPFLPTSTRSLGGSTAEQCEVPVAVWQGWHTQMYSHSRAHTHSLTLPLPTHTHACTHAHACTRSHMHIHTGTHA